MLRIFAVSEIAQYLRESLEADNLLTSLWIAGEASNVSLSQAGHLYFTLKDAGAQLRCVYFRRGWLVPPALKNGDAIVVHGRISFYEANGQLQLYADVIQPQGVGVLHLEFERLKAALEAEGLFDPTRKRPLPLFPKRIALLTSPTGAVLHDMVTIIGRRYPCVELVVFPIQVQGSGAAPSIVAAFEALNAFDDFDLAILARGGGSLEELWPFNEEQVVRAVFGCRVPVISAVGHETDVTLVDYVADMRAPTPSAAAELAVPDRAELLARLDGYARGLTQAVLTSVAQRSGDLAFAAHRLDRALPDFEGWSRRVEETVERLALHLRMRIDVLRERIGGIMAQLSSLEPRQTLARGYAIVQRQDTGAVVSRVAEVATGDALRVTVQDGSFIAEVQP